MSYCRPCGGTVLYADIVASAGHKHHLFDEHRAGAWELQRDGRYKRVPGSTSGIAAHRCDAKRAHAYWAVAS